MRVAIVCDKLTIPGGAEKVIEAWLEIFPTADIYTIFYDKTYYKNSIISKHKVIALSRLNWLTIFKPFSKNYFRALFFTYPKLIDSLNLQDYDLIISSHAVATQGVYAQKTQLHIAYIHTPLRYIYEQKNAVNKYPVVKLLYPLYNKLIAKFRKWDKKAAYRPHYVIVNSKNTYNKYLKHYKRKPDKILYPPVAIQEIISKSQKYKSKKDFYLVLSRLQEYKRIDIAVRTFNKYFPNKKLIIAGDGPELKFLKKLAKKNKNIIFTGLVSEAQKIKLLAYAKALIFPGEEDFGIVMVEALAAGTPVIAFGKGGATEILTTSTGILFNKQSPSKLAQAITQFENRAEEFKPTALRKQARKFSKERFQREFLRIVMKLRQVFQ